MLICPIWIRFLWTHTLLMVNLVETFLRTTKLLSRWSLKGEVQPWDMCLGHTELRWVGCSTESIRSQDPNQTCRHQKTKWQTCEPKVVLRVTNGTIICICLTSWIFRHPLAAISFKQKAEWCDVEKIPRRSFGRFADGEGEVKSDESCVVSKLVYCEAEFSKCEWTFRVSDRTDKPSSSFGRPSQGNTGGSLSLRSHEKPEGITSKIGSEHSEWNVSSPSFGDRCEEHGIKRVQKFQGGNTIVPAASGDRYEEHEHKKIEPIPNFVTWRSQPLSTRRRSFKTCRISWQEYRTYQNLKWKLIRPILWCGDGLWYRRWKLQYMWIRKFGRIQGFGFDDIESMFNATKRLIMGDLEIRNMRCLDCMSLSWTSSTLRVTTDKKWMKTKVCVFSDSVFCLGKIHTSREAIAQWKGQVATF